VALAKALVNEPELALPRRAHLGLDPDVAVRVRGTSRGVRRERGITIVLTTHYMREAEELCDEIAFIKAGNDPGARHVRRAQAPDPFGERSSRSSSIPPRCRGWPRARAFCAASSGRLVECTVDEAEKRVPELLRALVAEGVVVRNRAGARAGARGGLR
jgi:ABC-2 type transport system ATP-binding protein